MFHSLSRLRPAPLASAMAGLVVGAPALRIRGIYVMILTFGFGEIVRVFFTNFDPTGGASGLGGIPPLTAVVANRSRQLARVSPDMAHQAAAIWPRHDCVDQDDLAAEAMGINLTRTKLLSFSLGAMWRASPAAFTRITRCLSTPINSISARSAMAFLYVVLGGVANPFGPFVGATIVTLLPETLRFVQDWRMTVFGTLLMVLAIWRPRGS